MRDRLKARDAWIFLGSMILAYETFCPPGELLSEGVDRALLRSPRATRLAVTITALHLLNLIPERVDPYHQFAKVCRR